MIRRLLVVAVFVGAILGAGAPARANDSLCARVQLPDPAGTHTVCVSMP